MHFVAAVPSRPAPSSPPDPAREALLQAPHDDEPTTHEDRRALDEGREAVRRGEGVTTAELTRLLGL
jgi:hypothetical protein